MHSVIINQYEITHQAEINNQIKVRFKHKIEAYLENIPLSKLINEQTLSFEESVSLFLRIA